MWLWPGSDNRSEFNYSTSDWDSEVPEILISQLAMITICLFSLVLTKCMSPIRGKWSTSTNVDSSPCNRLDITSIYRLATCRREHGEPECDNDISPALAALFISRNDQNRTGHLFWRIHDLWSDSQGDLCTCKKNV